MTDRCSDLTRFYGLLGELERRVGGKRRLADCGGRDPWPARGVYFFFEDGEERCDTGSGPRVVRVGTHALKAHSRTSLWNRLSQHKGSVRSGGGNHRGSIFRLLVGTALIERNGYGCPSWDDGQSNAPREVRGSELTVEQAVSCTIGAMPFLWLAVDDEADRRSDRGVIEKGAIALLSNYGREPLDGPSRGWLGHYCARERVRASGLWNNNHVDEAHDEAFLSVLERHVLAVGMPT